MRGGMRVGKKKMCIRCKRMKAYQPWSHVTPAGKFVCYACTERKE